MGPKSEEQLNLRNVEAYEGNDKKEEPKDRENVKRSLLNSLVKSTEENRRENTPRTSCAEHELIIRPPAGLLLHVL